MLHAHFNQICKQEQKQEQKLDLVLHVPCLVAYVKNRETFIPIKPDVSKKEAKKTKYQYVEVSWSELGEHILWMKICKMPEALEKVCYLPGYPGIEEDQ